MRLGLRPLNKAITQTLSALFAVAKKKERASSFSLVFVLVPSFVIKVANSFNECLLSIDYYLPVPVRLW